MVGPIVLAAASAGLGALVGAATADRCSPPERRVGAGGAPSCRTCGGTGKVACQLCTRWSDGDVGCQACAGSGRTACRSCRGSGTGRRATVRAVTMRGLGRGPLQAVAKAAK